MRIKNFIIIFFLSLILIANPIFAYRVWEGENFQSKFNAARNNYLESLNIYKKSREKYLETLNRYKALQCKDENPKCQELKSETIEKAKLYLQRVTSSMIRFLNVLKVKVENIRVIKEEDKKKIISEIESDLNWLKAKEEEIGSFDTIEKITNFSENLKNFWRDEEVKIKKWVETLIYWKIEVVTEKIEEIISKIQDRINELDKEGYDIAEIQGYLDEAKANLNTCKSKREEFKTIVDSINFSNIADKFNEAKAKLKEIAKLFKEIHRDLKSFVGEVNRNKLQKREVSGSGMIMIKGEGFVTFNGQGKISGKIGNENFLGTLVITDKTGDVVVNTFNKGQKTELPDGRFQYKGVSNIQIEGSDMIIEISSDFIDIEALGKGTVTMRGDGLYKTRKVEWTDIPNTEIKVEI